MPAVTIRKAVSPDIEKLTQFDHTVTTDRVWQMSQNIDPQKISTFFNETKLPREMKLSYPRSPESLLTRWKDYSMLLTACADEVPVAYLSINTFFSTEMIWIKDLIVDREWRRRGIATTLFRAASEWGKSRNFVRATMEMASKNYPGICLARKLGFEFAGFNDHYLENNDIVLFFSRYIN